jgi:Flp pilus assembly protein TadD
MADISFKQGSQYFQMRDYFNAVQQFREAVRLLPDMARYRHALGKAMMRNPRWRKEAEHNFKKAIALDEFNAEYRVSLGILYLEAGLSGKAEAQFREALAWDSENQSALRQLAKLEGAKKSDSLFARFFGGKKKKS